MRVWTRKSALIQPRTSFEWAGLCQAEVFLASVALGGKAAAADMALGTPAASRVERFDRRPIEQNELLNIRIPVKFCQNSEKILKISSEIMKILRFLNIF